MPDRHTLLNSKALSTLLNPNDRISKIQDGGYGDFCFAPNKNYKCLDCFDPFNPTTYSTTAAETISDSISTLSISEAAASALQISFLNLPKDIRDIIYEYWIEPFRNPWYNGSIKVDVGVVHEMRCHPFRNGYTVGVPLSIKPPRCQPHGGPHRDVLHQHISRVSYERLRALSQVSRQLRSELGAIFWSNTYVDIDHWEYLFVDFLNDRPAIYGGIKRLRMEWACDESATDLDGGWNGIVKFCEFVKDKLVLDELEFVLDTTPIITREILGLRENLAWVRAFREIKTKRLKLRLFLCPDDDEDIDDDSSDDIDNSDEDNDQHSLENNESGDDESNSGSEHASENVDGDGSGADDDSDSSSSSSEDSVGLDFVEEEERRTELLASALEPLMEALLGPDVLQSVDTTEADEYLASRRAQEAEEEGSESSGSA